MNRQDRRHPFFSDPHLLVLWTSTNVGITLAAYARMTGFDPIRTFLMSSQAVADLLFAIVAGGCLAAAAFSLPRATTPTPTTLASPIFRVTVLSVVLVSGMTGVVAWFSSTPGETLRFLVSPFVSALLPALAGLNVWTASTGRGTALPSTRPSLVVGSSSLALGLVLHFATNFFDLEGFGLQCLILLLAIVIPLLALASVGLVVVRNGNFVSFKSACLFGASLVWLSVLATL